VALVLSVALWALGSGVSAAEPSPQASPDPPRAWLEGPFGTVPGGNPSEPATAAPDQAPLDTWMREASLHLGTDVAADDLVDLRVVATADGGTETQELTPDEEGWLVGPDQAGRHLVSATIESKARGIAELAWLIEVPDREGSWETLLEMPALEAELHSVAGSVDGIRGHGCYVGMCQEVGLRPPAESLTPLAVAVGETPELRLSDGSAIVHWEGRLEPLPGTPSETRPASATYEDEPQAVAGLSGLEPIMPGEWLLEIRTDFDRERGWQWFLYRLVAQ
jgi:hypothetical protein